MYYTYANSLGPGKIWDTEMYPIEGASLAAKVFGGVPSPNPQGQVLPLLEIAYPVPKYLRDEIEKKYGDMHTGIGSSIGILSPVDGKIKDNARELKQRIDRESILLWSK